MDTFDSPSEAKGLPGQGPHWRTYPANPVPTDFIPLRLVLQPSGAAIELSQTDTIVGRHSQADVRLPLPDVSRRHCRFLFAAGAWQIIDLNSLNGVFVNDKQVRQAVLKPGDLVRIGGFTFLVELAAPASRPAGESEDTQGLVRILFKTLPGPEPNRRAS